jgi:hypothetical protein
MLQYSLVIFATLGLAMTLIAMLGLVLVAGLRWALVDGRWSRTRADALVVNLRSVLARGRWLVRLLTRGLWPAGRGYRS